MGWGKGSDQTPEPPCHVWKCVDGNRQIAPHLHSMRGGPRPRGARCVPYGGRSSSDGMPTRIHATIACPEKPLVSSRAGRLFLNMTYHTTTDGWGSFPCNVHTENSLTSYRNKENVLADKSGSGDGDYPCFRVVSAKLKWIYKLYQSWSDIYYSNLEAENGCMRLYNFTAP